MENLSKVPKAAWAAAGVLVLAAIVVLAILLLSSSSEEGKYSFTGSGVPNGDLANTRQIDSQINSSNVTSLSEAWTSPIPGTSNFGSYASSPVIDKGVMYSQDLDSNVQAINLESGKVLWEKRFDSDTLGPNGVTVGGDSRVYGATATDAFALDQETGKELWSVALVRNEKEGVDIAPGYYDGTVYFSTAPTNTSGSYEGGGVGVLWALDAKTGRKLWHFDTVPKSLWGNPKVNSGGGLWYTPAFDGKGSMYFGVGNPAPFPGTPKKPWGSSRPGPNLYTDSIVKLDAKTGKLDWYYQLTPHDVNDWDLQDPPILLKAGGRDMVIGAGKSGIVIALDRKSGKLLWKRSVGRHNGHDDMGLEAMRGEYSKLKESVTVYPGSLGGVIAPMSTDGSTLFVPVVNNPAELIAGSEKKEPGPASGEIVALDAATGDVKWNQELSEPAFGATTAVNDLVFATSFEGQVFAFDASSGSIVWQEQLPAGTNSGVMVNGDTLIAPAGLAVAAGSTAQIVAYRLGG